MESTITSIDFGYVVARARVPQAGDRCVEVDILRSATGVYALSIKDIAQGRRSWYSIYLSPSLDRSLEILELKSPGARPLLEWV